MNHSEILPNTTYRIVAIHEESPLYDIAHHLIHSTVLTDSWDIYPPPVYSGTVIDGPLNSIRIHGFNHMVLVLPSEEPEKHEPTQEAP